MTTIRKGLLRAALSAGVAAVAAGAAAVLTLSPSAHAAGTLLPAHVFAPYFQAYSGDNLNTLSQQSGANYLTMAFVQTERTGSCTVYWDGDTGTPIAASSFGSQIDALRGRGGDVVPSFGGYAADNGATEIADSCTNVDSIAAQYEKVITTYNVTRLDMDIEDNSLTNSAGITRRSQAIKKTQDWAAANGRPLQIVFTLPTTTSGLASSGLNIITNAIANGVKVDIVNLMTFDYYDNATHNMANDTKTAATGLKNQLKNLYPAKTDAELWGMVGVTEMMGIDDFGAAETFQTADAPIVEAWAAQQGIAELSYWALQRDNGGCPGTAGSDTCSGVSQTQWQFSHAFEPFTSGTTTTSPSASASNPTSPSASPSASRSASPSPSTSPTGSCTAAAWVSTTAYNGGAVVSYNGHKYTAKWWTQGDQPDLNTGDGKPWTDNGPCGPSTSASASPSASPSRSASPSPSVSPSTPASPSPTASGSYPAWTAGHAYKAGDIVTYGGHTYKCLQPHTSLTGWEPPNVPALWQLIA
ncbi:carbohydrate-binding protein [Hamadaea tsunoensis]|uniref:carbohydrate-binding protein n=1 Tax=Hamadaea tsunoensis TaxID=53368 RepID=UPI00040DA441|nr:carbohydrate-binding protein [Hamadaea tsunoensis]